MSKEIMAEATQAETEGTPVEAAASSAKIISGITGETPASVTRVSGITNQLDPDRQRAQEIQRIVAEILNLPTNEERARRLQGLPRDQQRLVAEAILAGRGGGAEGEGGVEQEPSPEGIDRAMVREIYRIESTLPYEQRYALMTGLLSAVLSRDYPEIFNQPNVPYLDKLYQAAQAYVEDKRATRKGGERWDPRDDYLLEAPPRTIQEIRAVVDRRLAIRDRTPEQIEADIEAHLRVELERGLVAEQIPPEPEDFTDIPSLKNLIDAYNNKETPAEQVHIIEEHLMKYFREAKRKGLLGGVDQILTSVYQSHLRGLPPDEIRTLIKDKLVVSAQNNMPEAVITAEAAFEDLRSDPEVTRLANVWLPYLKIAIRRFENLLTGKERGPYGTGEFRLDLLQRGERETTTETYWRTGTWPEYYTVIARTPEQLRIATSSFLRMIKNKALGLSPDKLLPHMENFAKALGQAGNAPNVAATVTPTFMEELRQEFEGLAYIYGAWYTNETYNPEQYYRFMMAFALHEGPQRMTQLARAGNGQVAVFLKMFDDDSRTRVFYNSGGSRGQIGNDTITQNFLQQEYLEMLIEEGMGVRMKDYDPYDELLNADTPGGRDARRERMLKLGEIEAELRAIEAEVRSGKKRRKLSDDDQRIYDAFSNNRLRIGIHQSDSRFRSLYEGFDYDPVRARHSANANIKNWQEFRDIYERDPRLLPERLRRSVELGRVQETLQEKRAAIARGEIRLGRSQKAIDLLSLDDQAIYQAAYADAKSNFDIAYQMVGALQEKVKRGGGVFYAYRNPYRRAYEKSYLAWDKLPFDHLSREQKIGRLLTWFADGKESFTADEQAERAFWDSSPPEVKVDYVDNVPTDQATAFVQLVENKIKILYANASAADRQAAVDHGRADAIQQVLENGLQAKIVLSKARFDVHGNVIESDASQTETIELATADENPLSRWTSHSYWAYQPENRHMLTSPKVFVAAKRIRAGMSRPEDEDPLATQLLILDPTLKQVRRIHTDKMAREVIIFDAAVEASNYGHWRIDRELHAAFLPEDGDPNKIQVGYNREDFGGTGRFIIGNKAEVAVHSKRFARRYAGEIARSPIHVSSYPDIVAQKGVLGLITMHADPIGNMADQRVASQFSITKFVNQMRYGWMLFGALYGYEDSEKGESIEGIYEKPTNNSDKVASLFLQLQDAIEDPADENKLYYELLETFGRLWRVLKLIRVMESDVRNTQGALLTEGKDVFLPDGRFNREIVLDRFVGSSRHAERIFFDAYIDWLLSDKPGGGLATYPSDVGVYKFLRKPYKYRDINGNIVEDPNGRTWADWFFEKMGR